MKKQKPIGAPGRRGFHVGHGSPQPVKHRRTIARGVIAHREESPGPIDVCALIARWREAVAIGEVAAQGLSGVAKVGIPTNQH